MNEKKRFKKKNTRFVVAVQLDLETDGFTYTKWGGEQTCKKGDWIANNNGDVNTIDNVTFKLTYRSCGPGIYVKISSVWAIQAKDAGAIATKEGSTDYKQGDYIVSNNEDGTDCYAVTKDKFEEMYEPEL